MAPEKKLTNSQYRFLLGCQSDKGSSRDLPFQQIFWMFIEDEKLIVKEAVQSCENQVTEPYVPNK